MKSVEQYQVAIVPGQESVVSSCTLGEALAYQRGYQEVAQGRKAVICLATPHPETDGAPRRSSTLEVGRG